MKNVKRLAVLILLAACLLWPSRTLAASITLNLTSEPNEIYIGGFLPVLNLLIGARGISPVGWGGGTAEAKAGRLQEGFVAKQLADNTFFPKATAKVNPVMGANNQPDPSRAQLVIDGLPKNTSVTFSESISMASMMAHKAAKKPITGERRDSLRTTGKDPIGMIQFSSDAFPSCVVEEGDPPSCTPTEFTGGIISDLGELVFTLSATDILDLSGAGVIAALYGKLAPSISSFDVQILNYTPGDDFLTFLFDPNNLLSEVVFGTSAAGGTVSGSLQAAEPIPEPSSLVLLASALLCGGAVLSRSRRGPVTTRHDS
jgi:hypothetical protein